MRMLFKVMAVATVLMLTACNFQATSSQSNAELNARAAANFADLAAGRDAAVIGRMSSTTDPAEVRAQLPILRRLVGQGEAGSPTVLGTRTSITNQGRFYEVVQVFPYPDRVARVTTVFIYQGGGWKVHGFNINVGAQPGGPQPAPGRPPLRAPSGIQT